MHKTSAALLLAASCAAGAQPAPCAHTVDGLRALLRDPQFPLAWEEISMEDGRALVVTLDERDGGLHLAIAKAGEGPWAAGHATVCTADGGLKARFDPQRLRLGAAGSWLLRQALQAGAAVNLRRVSAGELRIGTVGWSGRFAPASPQVGLRAP